MKRPINTALAFAVLIAVTGAANAGPVFDNGNELGLLDADPVDMDSVRHRDGTLVAREAFKHSDGSVVTRLTAHQPAPQFSTERSVARDVLELTPAQRRLIWYTVAVPAAAMTDDQSADLPLPIAREHIEAIPTPRSYRVGSIVPFASVLQPLPETVTVAVPTVQDHLYAVVGERVFVVDPVTNTVVVEVGR